MAGRAEKTDMAERRVLALMALMALWLAAWAYSILLLLTTPEPPAAGGPGMPRSVGFLGWQGVAGMLAFGCWGIGRSFPRGTGIRRASAVPLVLAIALVLVLAAMALFSG